MNIKQKQFIDTFLGMPLVYVNLLLAKIMGRLSGRNHGLSQAPSEIIFIKILGFGSVLMASDSIYSIKKKYPSSRISIICSRGIAEGVASLKLFDNLYIIDDSKFAPTVFSTLRILFKLWRKRNKWVVDLEVYSKLTSIVSLWTLALNRFGFYHTPVAFRYNLNTHNIYFNTHHSFTSNCEAMASAMHVTSAEKFNLVNSPNQNGSRNYILINNTCSDLSIERKMSRAQLIELCNWVSTNTDYKLGLLGAPSDYSYNEAIILEVLIPAKVENLAGRFKFEDYFRFLSENCHLLITIDSAPLHIATKLGLKTISIWGPTSPWNSIDMLPQNDFIYLGKPCSPCVHLTDKLPCNGDNICMKHINMPDVFNLIKQHLPIMSKLTFSA